MAHHHRRHSRKSAGNTLFSILIVIIAVTMLGVFYYDHVQEQKREEKLRIVSQQAVEERQAQLEAERQVQLEREQLRTNDSFYQLLADGFDVNVLIVGDSIGEGAGATDYEHGWANLLKANLESTYNIAVKLTNVSMGGNASYAGYVRTIALDDGVNYDLVVLCYGQNDGNDNFSLYYESIIRAVKNRYPKAAIISVLESSQREYTEKMRTIQSIAEHYGIPVADTIAPFQANYDALVADGVHPNDDGYMVYYETIMNIIRPLAAERRGNDPADVALINEQVTIFDTYQWYGKDQFTREGNTFTLKTAIRGTVLGIDYVFTTGTNSCKILIDGKEYAAPEVTFNYDFSQRHIMMVNNWMQGDTLDVQNEIKVIFGEDEAGGKQADGFNGLVVSGL